VLLPTCQVAAKASGMRIPSSTLEYSTVKNLGGTMKQRRDSGQGRHSRV
jgi:hypothetical protein